MGELQAGSLENAAQSYALWWREAGLLHATDDVPHRWREPAVAPFWQREVSTSHKQPTSSAASNQPAPITAAAPTALAPVVANPAASSVSMPQQLDAFLDWLQKDTSQPEANWTGALLTPPALVDRPLLLVVDMPAPDTTDQANLLEPSQRRFANAMLASLGLVAEDVPTLSLSMRCAPAGVMEEGVQSHLGKRMRHYIGLTRPKAVILIGDRTSRAILGKSWSPSNGGIFEIDHQGGKTSAVTLPGMEMLMGRAAAKAKSWQTLRLLHGMLD